MQTRTRSRRNAGFSTVQQLELRELKSATQYQPTQQGSGEQVDSVSFQFGEDIQLSSGTLHVWGTDNADTIRIEEQTVISGSKSGKSVYQKWIRATVEDAQGVVTAQEEFSASSVNYIIVYGLDGDDQIRNETNVPSLLKGGDGNDDIRGGSAGDDIRGERGNDDLFGRNGNDTISGNQGEDYIRGGRGRDTLNGGSRNDTLIGDQGHDIIDGGNGDDTIWGSVGNDDISGGAGDDSIYAGLGDDIVAGNAGNDTLFGEEGNDILQGGAGDDDIYGGSGNDKLQGQDGSDDLRGESGNDRLFGGRDDDDLEGGSGADGLFGGEDTDTLNGGTGGDRFLLWRDQTNGAASPTHDDTVEDVSAIDAEVEFIDTNSGAVVSVYSRAAWTSEEIEAADLGLDILMQRTGNTDLLKKPGGGIIKIKRFGVRNSDPDSNLSGSNNDSRIAMLDNAFDGTDETEVAYVLMHEIGHFWDESGENSLIPGFQAMSGWDSLPRSGAPAGFEVSGDGKWMYRSESGFVSIYAADQPREDWAETFATNLMLRAGYTTDEDEWHELTVVTESRVDSAADKMELLDDFFSAF